jgi:predicted permease
MSWLKQMFSRRLYYRELSEEIREHLEEKAEELMAGGMSKEEATGAARREFGNVTLIEERSREVWQWPSVESFFIDVLYGLRQIRRNPGFTFVVILTLALGIGVNAAVFSVVNAVLLKPLHYPRADQIVMIQEKVSLPGYEDDLDMISPADFADWSTRNTSFEDIAAIRYQSFDVTGNGEPARVEGSAVSASLFSVLRVDAALGRVFTQEEDRYGGPRVVLLGHGLWVSRFGSNPQMVGQSIRLNNESYTVIGVMPKWFHFPDQDDQLWVPLDLRADEFTNRLDRSVLVAARLRQGVGLKQARAQMDAAGRQLAQQYPATNTGVRALVVSLREQIVGDVRPAILILWACTGFVLLIVCANISNLLLTRASVRRREFAIRVALGAARVRIVRQLLTESILLALLGGILGLVVALWGMHAIRWISPPDSFPYLPRLDEIGIDRSMLSFTLGISLLAGFSFGLIPALQTGRSNLQEPLKESGRISGGGRDSWTRMLLIVAETALCTIVLVGAGLLLRSFLRLAQVPLGFQPRNVLSLRVIPRGPRYSNQAERSSFYQQALQKVDTIPGIQSAGAINFLPLTQVWHVDKFSVQGQTLPMPGEQPVADFRPVTPGYFPSMGIPIIGGRDFSWADAPGSLPVVIISDAVARRFWPKDDPVGRHIKQGLPDSPGAWLTVVGVVGDVRYYDVASKPQPTVYLPYAQSQSTSMALHDLVVRTAVDPSSVASAVRSAIWSVDGSLSVSRVRTMEEVYSISVTPQRFNLQLLGLLACVAVILAAVGLYGVTAYAVQQRTHEIGVRIALGADPHHVIGLVLFQGTKLALAGVAIGIVTAFLLTRLMKSLLFTVTASDPLTFVGVPSILMIVALAACYIPARRIMGVDPMTALRHE